MTVDINDIFLLNLPTSGTLSILFPTVIILSSSSGLKSKDCNVFSTSSDWWTESGWEMSRT